MAMVRIALACVALLLCVTANASASDWGVTDASLSLSTTQAGAHADVTTGFDLPQTPSGGIVEDLHDVHVSLPSGFWGTPAGFDTCTEHQMVFLGLIGCPPGSQIGTLTLNVWLSYGFGFNFTAPLFNMEHGPDLAAQFGSPTLGLNALLRVKVRPGDYGLDTVSLSAPDGPVLQIRGVSVTLWGVPADHNGSGEPREPLMTNPASCEAPLTASFSADSWEHLGVFNPVTASVGPLTGCDRMPTLQPTLQAAPTGTAADEPAGYDIDVKVPQNDDPDGVATPTVKALAVTFPKGVAISPAASSGLDVCTDAQLGAGSDAEPTCPDASKVGDVTIKTPALATPLQGAMYLASSKPGHLFRMFLVAKGTGVVLKLGGDVAVDPATGQVTTTFSDTPALPFSELHVQLKDGSHALLSNPLTCGTYTTTAKLTPYGGGPDGVATSDFTISSDGAGGACPADLPFAPKLTAGTMSPVAGASSPFQFRLTRADGQRELGAIGSVHLPAGLIADVAQVPLCGEAAAAAGTCPAASRIGSVLVGSGSGATPLYLPGSVYLTGPYKGAPFGLSIVVDAITGPYDLGTVNVRAAVKVNPDASLSVESDPLPTILQGVPLRLRDIVLKFDRPGFMLNPTSCAPSSVTATAVAVDGTQAAVSSPFGLMGCADLGYKPKLSLKLGARSRTGNVGLQAHLRTRPGDANTRKVVVKLPKLVGLNLKNAQALCSDAQMAANSCPAASIVGRASVASILHVPLTGPVYFVQGASNGKGSGLPRLYIPLSGEGVTIPLVAQSSLERGHIVTTFDNVPDVPFSRFDLTIDGGSHGILTMPAKACTSTQYAVTQLDGYNGKIADAVRAASKRCARRPAHR